MAFIIDPRGDGSSSFSGTGDADTLQGLGGDDTLQGLGGNDLLLGGDGLDILTGGGGDDTLAGGAGIDLANYNNASGPIFADLAAGTVTGEGTDTLIFVEGVLGTAFADTLLGDDGGNWFRGRGGNDTIDGGGGVDITDYSNASGGVAVNLATGVTSGPDGSDTLISIEGIFGSSHADTLTGDGGDNVFRGRGGNDTIDGAAGFDTAIYIHAASGVSVNLSAGTASGAEGDDTLISIEGAVGSSNGDTLIGSDGDDLLDGGAGSGADFLRGGLGDDTLIGGGGFDTADYRQAPGAVYVDLGAGVAGGSDGNDLLSGIEIVYGSGYNDVLIGSDGLDIFQGGNGSDWIDGRGGTDLAWYEDFDDPINGSLATGVFVTASGTDTLVSIEYVRGSYGNDTITGSSADESIAGGEGNDSLDGGGGIDYASYRWASGGVTASLATNTSSGADGNDTLANFEGLLGSTFADTLTGDELNNWFNGRAGNDTIDGGPGIDTVVYSDAGSGVTVNLGAGTVSGGDGSDVLGNIENIVGSGWADTLIGNNGPNSIVGGTGDDVMRGNGGDDTLVGGGGSDFAQYNTGPVTVNLALGTATGEGNDTLVEIFGVIASPLADTLIGDDAANFLRGNLGDDTLDGGGGDDLADYRSASGPVTVSLQSNTSSGADGNDTLISIEGIRGSAFGDTLTGNDGNNFFRGLDGDDTIDGAGGNDAIDFRNAGNGVIVDLAAGTAIGEGNDTLISIEFVRGSDYDDWLIGNASVNRLRGRAGTDTLDGGANFDFAEYNEAGGPVVVDLGRGLASGADGDDILIAIEGVIGSPYDDHLTGSDENNILRGGDGADTLDGGEGDDVAEYVEATGPITFDLANRVFTGAAALDTLISIEGVYGTAFDDLLVGDGGSNVMRSNGGTDTMHGGAGSDDRIDFVWAPVGVRASLATNTVAPVDGGTALDGNIPVFSNFEGIYGTRNADHLIGDGADNVLRGREGDDTLEGGAGFDTASYGNAPGSVTVDLQAQTASGADGNDQLVSIERVSGSESDDTLLGSSGDDAFQGMEGDDVIDGRAGFDVAEYRGDRAEFVVTTAGGVTTVSHLSGKEGADTLTGIELLSFDDVEIGLVPVGTAGDDTLTGTRGNDTIVGGDGIDTAEIDVLLANLEWALDGAGRLALSDTTGAIGADTLDGIERLALSDGTIEVEDLVRGGDLLYAFYNPVRDQTIYTASVAEREAWMDDASLGASTPGLLPGGQFAAPLEGPGTIPVWRFETPNGAYFWTADADFKDLLLVAYPTLEYQGVAFHAYGQAAPGRTEVVTLWDSTPATQGAIDLVNAFGSFLYTDPVGAQDLVDASPTVALLGPVVGGLDSFWL